LLKLYKHKFPEGNLIRFEDYIKKFEKFYKKRYVQPDKSHIILESWSPTIETRDIANEFIKGKYKLEDYVEWTTEEIDEVIFNICKDIETGTPSIFDYINLVADLSSEFTKNNKFFKKHEKIFH